MKMNTKLVVIGGTGLIGSRLVNHLRQRGQQAVAASPSTGVNTVTGQGLAEALNGAQVVVDVANYGIAVNDQSLVPGPNPRLGSTHFAEWLRQSISRGELRKAA